ncbi:MAG: hypothetical protein AAB407_01220 [Patescibacteria group bacterium]
MRSVKKYSIIAIALTVLFIFHNVEAQTAPEALLSWSANTSAPSFYHAKRLPTRGSSIQAHIELIHQNKIVSLSGKKITWLVENQLYASKIGQKDFSFEIPTGAGDAIRVTAVILNYNGKDVRKTIEIPVTNPRVSINAPFPFGTVSVSQITLKAFTFFFSSNNLSYTWEVNGVTPTEGAGNPSELNLSLSPEGSGDISVSLSVNNPQNPLEFGDASQLLRYIHE